LTANLIVLRRLYCHINWQRRWSYLEGCIVTLIYSIVDHTLRRLYCHNLDDPRMLMEYLLQSSNVIGVNFVTLNSVLPF